MNEVFDLRLWQEKAIGYFFSNQNSVYEVCTGAGKTFFAIEAIKKVLELDYFSKIIIVAPKNVVCDMWHQALLDQGFSELDVGMCYEGQRTDSRIVITNNDSVKNLDLNKFDFGIFDEVHNMGTDRLLQVLRHPYKYRMGLTATIERLDGNEWAILDIFDYNRFEYTTEEGITDGVINDFEFTTIGVVMDPESYNEYNVLTKNINKILKIAGGYKRLMRSKKTETRIQYLSLNNQRNMLINNYPKKFDVLKKICSTHKDEKTIIFSQFNETSDKVYWYLLDVDVDSRVIHSGKTTSQRIKTLQDFNDNKFSVLVATKVLDEGWNVPACQNGIILANSSNKKQIIQRLGRILRKKDDPSQLYYLYCVNTVEQDYMKEHYARFSKIALKSNTYIDAAN